MMVCITVFLQQGRLDPRLPQLLTSESLQKLGFPLPVQMWTDKYSLLYVESYRLEGQVQKEEHLSELLRQIAMTSDSV
jgi:hypothetical protein